MKKALMEADGSGSNDASLLKAAPTMPGGFLANPLHAVVGFGSTRKIGKTDQDRRV